MTEAKIALPSVFQGLVDPAARRKDFLTGRRRLSFGELYKKVAKTRGLFARLGLGIGDRAAVASEDEEAVSILYAACLLSGVTAVVIDHEASASEATVLVAKAQPKAAFLDQSLIDRTQSLKRGDGPTLIPVLRQARRTSFGLIVRKRQTGLVGTHFPAMLEREEPVEDGLEVPADAAALILFTSGTTSSPKGVELTIGNLAAQLDTFRTHFGIDASCRIANHLALHHSDGLNQGPLLSFATGATWIRPPSLNMHNLGDMLDLVYKERATHLMTVPTVLAMMLRLPATFDDSFSSPQFRFIGSTAGYLDESLWRNVEDRFQALVVNSYGLTETVCEALYCGPTESTRRIGTIGKPVGCEARLVKPDGEEADVGETGRLLLRGANIMRRYFEDAEATRSAFREGWLVSGDLATRDSDGFYRIVGREKNVIIRAGLNVYPEDVSAALQARDDLTEAVTVGLPDPFLGEKVISCVVAADGASRPSQEALFDYCRTRLAPEKIPNQILLVESLPRGPSGKVELAKVSTMIEQIRSNPDADAARASPLEQVMRLAASVFKQPVATLADRSSEADTEGWDSLSFLEFIVALESRFNFSFPPRDLMRIRTLGDACRIVESKINAETKEQGQK